MTPRGKGKGGERRGGARCVAYTASIFIHQPRLRFFPTEDSFAVFPLERQMRIGRSNFSAARTSIHHHRDLNEPRRFTKFLLLSPFSPLLLPISEEEKETAKSRRAIVTSDDFARKSGPM